VNLRALAVRPWGSVLLLLASAGLAGTLAVPLGAAEVLDLRASTREPRGRIAGPLPLTVSLVNRSAREVLVLAPFGCLSATDMTPRAFMLATLSGGASLSFKVVTSPGAAPRWNGAVVDSRHRRTRDSFTRIGPGKSLDVHLDLAQELTFLRHRGALRKQLSR
jgi:hypothetical protein